MNLTETKQLPHTKLNKAPLSKQAKIHRLLQQAESALKKYQLTTPKDASAYTRYKHVLALDPKNTEAQVGIDKIANSYYLLAKKVKERGDYAQARQYVTIGLEVRPRHNLLLEFQRELNRGEGRAGSTVLYWLNRIKKSFQK